MITQTLERRRPTLADLLPHTLVGEMVLPVLFAGFIGLFAQIAVHLPFTPVPMTGQTFAVLLGGAALGWRRSATGGLLYLAAGMIGVPWFAGGAGGFAILNSPSFGYLIGFILAASLVGWLASKGLDRGPLRTVFTMVIGNIVIYGLGALVLGMTLHVGFSRSIALGVTPFLLGDAIKLILAAVLLPGAWYAIARYFPNTSGRKEVLSRTSLS